MQTVSTSKSIVIPAPAWYCFDRYTDLDAYPTWERSAKRATELSRSPDGRVRRVEFEWAKELWGLPLSKLTYSLRCEHHSLGRDTFFIKFDEAEGDLKYLLTVVEFRAADPVAHPDSTLLTYKSVIGDPWRFRRTLLMLFGPAELSRHLKAFDHYVQGAYAEERPLALAE